MMVVFGNLSPEGQEADPLPLGVREELLLVVHVEYGDEAVLEGLADGPIDPGEEAGVDRVGGGMAGIAYSQRGELEDDVIGLFRVQVRLVQPGANGDGRKPESPSPHPQADTRPG